MFDTQAGSGDQVVLNVPPDNPNSAVHIPEGSFALLIHTAQNASLTNAVTALAFDPYEELLWSGNSAGRVVSYYGTQLEKYTAFVTGQTDVRSMIVTETAVLALTAQRLKANRRQGISIFNHTSENMTDLTCIHRHPDAPHTVLMGGNQPRIIQLDLETQKETRIVHLKQKNCSGLRSNQKFLFSSDSDGNITLRHLTTVDAIHALQAHQGAIADFDVCGNKLITCGYSPRLGTLSGDRFLMVFDLRTLRPLPPAPMPITPSFVRFLPSYSDSRIMVASQAGEMIVLDLNDQTGLIPVQLDTNGFALFSLDISPSRQCIAFGDQTGFIHLFSDRAQPVFNENAWETEFPDPVVVHPAMGFDDPEPPFAVFPLPFSTENGYLSDWPEHLCERAFREPDPIPKQISDSIRMVQFVGYAPNPRADTPLRVYNIQPYSDVNTILSRSNNSTEKPQETSPQSIPKFYRRVHVRPSRYNNEEFDYVRYNRTELVPIEFCAVLPEANAILLALYHVLSVRNIFMQHICFEEHCMSCEIGFLFRMLTDRAPVQPASAANFARSVRSIKESSHLFDENSQKDSLPLRSRAFLNFLCSRVTEELGDTPPGVTYRDELGMTFNLNNRCIRCSEQYQSSSSHLTLRLTYPTNGDNVAFCNVLEKSLNCPEQSEAVCQKCNKLARITSTRRISQLPLVLLVDTGITSDAEKSFWTSQLQSFEKRPPPKLSSSQSSSSLERFQKMCRYGDECKKPFCKYSHHGDIKNDTLSDCEEGSSASNHGEEHEWQHYIPATMRIKATEGICTVSENAIESAVCYTLRCAVFAIGDTSGGEPTHLVTAVRPRISDRASNTLQPLTTGQRVNKERSWVVFNEFVVTRVTENEALHLDTKWKLPCLLLYVQADIDASPVPEIRMKIPSSVFWADTNLAAGDIRTKLQEDNLPKKGDIVAIDAEFISLNTEGSRSVARVSCVREDGYCFLDDYIRPCSADTVTDYLTAYSGIEAADLDPKQSTRHLTTLKGTYLKLLYLLQQGVIFVGHGLNNDFKALNIYVPAEQMRDTVHLFHLPAQRMISLQFLAWHLFDESIQQTAHDSAEDARMAFRLYNKYLQLKEAGELEAAVAALYETGKRLNWKVNGTETPVNSEQ